MKPQIFTTVTTCRIEPVGKILVPALLLLALLAPSVRADDQPLKPPVVEDWSNISRITAENDWSGVPGFMGYRGEKLAGKPGMNPQAITMDGLNTTVNVLANQKNPNSLRTGGVAEFDTIPNPTIAIKGSGTASAPFLLLNLDTRGKHNITIGYKLRDLDASSNNAEQPVALQYRAQLNGPFIDIASAFVPDASTGPNLATLVTPIVVVLPEEANDKPLVQVRWITANAAGNDEWIGIDDIAVIGDDLAVAVNVPKPVGQ